MSDVLARFQYASLRLLVTSRRSDFPEEAGLQIQELGLFTEAECLDFLEKTLKQQGSFDTRKLLIETLGRLPLALVMATKYITTKWHQSQTEKELPDGRLEVRLRVKGFGGIKKWICGWVPFVEIAEP